MRHKPRTPCYDTVMSYGGLWQKIMNYGRNLDWGVESIVNWCGENGKAGWEAIHKKNQSKKLYIFSLLCIAIKITNNNWKQTMRLFSSVASPICQDGQSERIFPIFPFSSRFFLFLLIFSPIFSLFIPIFGNFFAVRRGILPPWPPDGYSTATLLRIRCKGGNIVVKLGKILHRLVSKLYTQYGVTFCTDWCPG